MLNDPTQFLLNFCNSLSFSVVTSVFLKLWSSGRISEQLNKNVDPWISCHIKRKSLGTELENFPFQQFS